MTEYTIKRSENVLTLRRTKPWTLASLAGLLFPLAGAVFVGHDFRTHPIDKFSLFLSVVFLCGMVFVFYRLLIWGRCVVFDKTNNLFLIDGHKVCALSDLTSVQMEHSQRSTMSLGRGRFYGLHLRMAQGKDITLKWAWEGNPDYGELTELVRLIAEFVSVKTSIA
jgi:hypothetical protein